jgi:hypothetical protein
MNLTVSGRVQGTLNFHFVQADQDSELIRLSYALLNLVPKKLLRALRMPGTDQGITAYFLSARIP